MKRRDDHLIATYKHFLMLHNNETHADSYYTSVSGQRLTRPDQAYFAPVQ